jgi:hypothetical protein
MGMEEYIQVSFLKISLNMLSRTAKLDFLFTLIIAWTVLIGLIGPLFVDQL